MSGSELRSPEGPGAADLGENLESAAHPFRGQLERTGLKVSFEKTSLNCISAADLGLGTCWCNSHPTYVSRSLTLMDVIKELENGYRYADVLVYEDHIDVKVVLKTRRNQRGETIDDTIIWITIEPGEITLRPQPHRLEEVPVRSSDAWGERNEQSV